MSETTTPPFRTVPNPTTDTAALLATCLALKENVDSLTRQRGDPQVWAATVREVATGANGDGQFPTNAAYLRGLVDQAVTLVGALSQTIGGKLNTAGGAMTGPLTLVGNPTAAMEAATKAYVDLNGATAWADIPNRPVAFPPKPHNHPINDIVLLQVELDNRALREHVHTWAELIPPEGADLGAGHVLTWDGAKLTLRAPTGGTGGLYIGAAPPGNPAQTPFWFDATAGNLLISYNDGNSQQWVPTTTPLPGPPGPPGLPGTDGVTPEYVATLESRVTTMEASLLVMQAQIDQMALSGAIQNNYVELGYFDTGYIITAVDEVVAQSDYINSGYVASGYMQ